MRILGRYIFREIISSSLLGMALATSIIFLQGVGKLFEVLVRSSPRPETILYLFALSLPPLLPLTIPFGALVGILVGLGRLATDGEITAMRAAGCSSRKVVLPVMLFAFIAMLVAGAMTLRLTPLSMRVSKDILDKLVRFRKSAPTSSRAFSTRISPIRFCTWATCGRARWCVWRNVFLADLTPPEQRTSGMGDKAAGPADHRGAGSHRGARSGSQPVAAFHAQRRDSRDGQGSERLRQLLTRLWRRRCMRRLPCRAPASPSAR